jgi:anaerobic magnesium-protoporphyrin IX monomethyl ester cyclase
MEYFLRVLFVQSPVGRHEAPIYPIGLAYLAGSTGSHEYSAIDLSIVKNPGGALKLELERVKPDVVAVSVRNIDDSSYPVTHWYLDSFDEIMSVLNDWKGSVIAGGAGFSIYPDKIMELWPRIDIGLVGEGELALPAILAYLCGGPAPSWLVNGLATPPRPELNNLPQPDYSIFPASDYPGRGSAGVQTRRGCVFNCSYCTYKSVSGSCFRLRPLEQIKSDIEKISEQGFDSFMFVDSVFDHPLEYYKKIVAALSEIPGIPAWGAWLSESVPLDSLENLYRAGCRWVDFSPDVITEKGWKLMGKGGSIHLLWPAVKMARKAGLTVGVNFFSASPGENFLALLGKFFFMVKARLLLGWGSTFINIGTIRLYRGAPLSLKIYPDQDLFRPVFYRPRGLADLAVRVWQSVRRSRR